MEMSVSKRFLLTKLEERETECESREKMDLLTFEHNL